jgi:hypothetical protein
VDRREVVDLITYVPAFTVFLFIEIVKPEPTVQASALAFVAPSVTLATASVARIVVTPPVISRIGRSLASRVRTGYVSPRERRGEAQLSASRQAASSYCGYPPAARRFRPPQGPRGRVAPCERLAWGCVIAERQLDAQRCARTRRACQTHRSSDRLDAIFQAE